MLTENLAEDNIVCLAISLLCKHGSVDLNA